MGLTPGLAEATAALASPSCVSAADQEQVARFFHEAYERLAPQYGYETRAESAVPWKDVPARNRSLMIAVAGEVLAALSAGEEQDGPYGCSGGDYHLPACGGTC